MTPGERRRTWVGLAFISPWIIGFVAFTKALAPIAFLGLGIIWVVIVLVYRRDFRAEFFEHTYQLTPEVKRPEKLRVPCSYSWDRATISGLPHCSHRYAITCPVAAIVLLPIWPLQIQYPFNQGF